MKAPIPRINDICESLGKWVKSVNSCCPSSTTILFIYSGHRKVRFPMMGWMCICISRRAKLGHAAVTLKHLSILLQLFGIEESATTIEVMQPHMDDEYTNFIQLCRHSSKHWQFHLDLVRYGFLDTSSTKIVE